MADTGFNWDADWTDIDSAVALTQGGTTDDTSSVISMDGKAAALISIDVDYSDHAKATGGLSVYLCRDINGTDYEVEGDGPWGFEMPFTQNDTHRRTIAISAAQWDKFKIYLDWDNSTGSSVATIDTKIKYATIPAAS